MGRGSTLRLALELEWRISHCTGMGAANLITDVGAADFEEQVLVRSETTPVVVDFWAPWCAPCRSLGPVLERLAEEFTGQFVLAKVDIDRNPELAAHYGIRSIPAVLGFVGREIRSEFRGAQPEAPVRRFVQALLPTEADQRARQGRDRVLAADIAGAEQAFRSALELEERHPAALLGLARILAERAEDEEAAGLLDLVSPVSSLAVEAERLAAELRTRATGPVDESKLRAQIAARPEDLQARLDLGRSLAAQKRYEDALEELLQVVRMNPEFEDQASRRIMIDIFEVLGATDPRTERFRRELGRALFR